MIALLMVLPLPPTSTVTIAPRVRPLSNVSRSIVNEAMRRSPTIRRLMQELQQLDVIVFVDINMTPASTLGTTSVMANAGGFRMLRVLIGGDLDPRRRIEVLGHELQHALEIALERAVVNDATLRQLYDRIGYPIGLTSYETDRARQVEAQVRQELASRN